MSCRQRVWPDEKTAYWRLISEYIAWLRVLSPKVKLWVNMPGYYLRMFEDAREAECLAHEGRCAARWVLEGLRRTPHNTIQHANKIVKEATIDFFTRYPTSEMRCRRGYNTVALEMAYESTQMAVKLLGVTVRTPGPTPLTKVSSRQP